MDASPFRAALVTGGARRIGRVLVETLAADGIAVAIHCRRSTEDAEALAACIGARGGRAVVLAADIAAEGEAEALLARAADALGPIDLLVNNAAVFERDEVDGVTRASWDLHLETNVRAPFVLSQLLARRLPDDREGLIVNLLDQRVWSLTPHFVSYTTSKSALWSLTRSLALALAPRLRVCAIGPGPSLPSPRQSDEQFARQVASVPLRRGPAPEDFAAALRFLIAARAFTGQMLALDGGQHLNWGAARDDAAEE